MKMDKGREENKAGRLLRTSKKVSAMSRKERRAQPRNAAEDIKRRNNETDLTEIKSKFPGYLLNGGGVEGGKGEVRFQSFQREQVGKR